MSSSVIIDNEGKYILILGERLDDTTLTAEAIYPINFTQPNKRFVLSLHYNGSNSFLFSVLVASVSQIYQFKATGSEIKDYPLCLGNIQQDFTINNMKKRIKRSCKMFFC